MQSEQCIVVKDKEQNVLGYGLSIQTPENKIIWLLLKMMRWQ